MPEHYRALIVILVLAGVTFGILRRTVIVTAQADNFARRRNLWFTLTIVAFASYSFWLYAAVATIILAFAQQRETNIPGLFLALIFVIPPASIDIPGFGVINYFFALNHLRLLSLVILLPAFISLLRQRETLPLGRIWPDRMLLVYLFLVVTLSLRESSVSDTLRLAFYQFIDVFLPYYVASRGVRKLADLKEAMLAFVVAATLLAVVAIFELSRHWLLYSAVIKSMGITWDYNSYLGRGGSLRAVATAGQAIALGFSLAVALGLSLALLPGMRTKLSKLVVIALLSFGLIASLSRGPWLGTLAIVVAFISTGRSAKRQLAALVIAGFSILAVLAVLPTGQKIFDLLPFLGTVEKGNVTYRERLIENALIVIQRNPWFGSVDYLKASEMEGLRQGQGIIDIVNTYIGVALEYGLVGLALFVGFFILVLRGVRKVMRTYHDPEDEIARFGRALFATLLGILVIIFTVSSITIIPVVYWSVAGLAVAYAQMARSRFNYET